jgi:hypothetical protein
MTSVVVIFFLAASYCLIKTVMEVFMTNDRKSGYQRAISRELFTEVACDYVLPDYLGEVRKILYTEARAMPLPTYMNGEEASASGGVRFRMVYTDDEGRLASVEFSEDYEIRERIVTEDRGEVSAETAVESSSMRLLGPRKISAKARVAVELMLLTDEDVEYVIQSYQQVITEYMK